MAFLDLTLPTAAENVALDEALLQTAENGRSGGETLRLWEAREPVVVVGRSSQVAQEVNLAACRRRGIEVLRRTSGGAAIVAGPGCLMYAMLISYRRRPALRMIDQTHQFVLNRLAAAIGRLVPGVQVCGTSDLALGGKKFSGNSMRCRKRFLLYHGTLLYDFPLQLVGQCLSMPPRQPDYRRGRNHNDFMTNLPLSGDALRQAVLSAWDSPAIAACWPKKMTRELVAERYLRPEWNFRR